jgi:hypothetical protein
MDTYFAAYWSDSCFTSSEEEEEICCDTDVLHFPNRLIFVCLFAFFVAYFLTYFVHDVGTTVSYDQE